MLKEIMLEPENCIVTLINTKRNRTFLEKAVHKEFFDMSIVYHQFLPDYRPLPGEKFASVAVREEMLQRAGITLEELHDTAFQITMREFPAQMEQISESFYMVSNYLRSYGAAAMFDMKFMEKTAGKFGENFYIIPCSMDMIEIVAESRIEAEELSGLFERWNANLEERKILSDNLYLYNRRKKQIEIVK